MQSGGDANEPKSSSCVSVVTSRPATPQVRGQRRITSMEVAGRSRLGHRQLGRITEARRSPTGLLTSSDIPEHWPKLRLQVEPAIVPGLFSVRFRAARRFQAAAGVRCKWMDSSFSGPSAAVSASAKEAANGEPSHKRRRNLLIFLASGGAVGAVAAVLTYSHWNPKQTSGTTASGGTHATLAAATKCLTARRALVTPISGRRDFPSARAIRASFVLLPTRPFDSAILFFEPNRATAQRELAALAARQKLNVSSSYFNSYFQVKNNVVVFWENPKATPASRSAILGCLS